MSEGKIYRYPGIRPFELSEKSLFFGREEDIEKLYKRIRISNLLVLYAKSGLGKSSLLAAGLLPYLEKKEEKSCAAYIRFGSFSPEGSSNAINLTDIFLKKLENTFSYLNTKPNALIEHAGGENEYWKFFKSVQKNNIDTIYLVIDQAEEIFTYPEKSFHELAVLFGEIMRSHHPVEISKRIKRLYVNEEIGEEEFQFLNKPLNIKLLLAIRSDKLSLLNQLSGEIPEILNDCFELKALNRFQAEDAIVGPSFSRSSALISPRFEYSEEALKDILDFLSKNNTKPIESFQLQIICRHVENIVIEEKHERILREHLGNMEDVLQNYYVAEISKLDTENERQLAQKLIEEGLILEEEARRVSLLDGVIKYKFKVPQDLLNKLEDSRLIRSEPNLDGGYIYELSHDTLVEPIIRSRKKRLQEAHIRSHEGLKLKKRFVFVLVGVLAAGSLVVFYWYAEYRRKEEQLVFIRTEQNDTTSTNHQSNIVQAEMLELKEKLNYYMKRVEKIERDSLSRLYTQNTSSQVLQNKIAELKRQRDIAYTEFLVASKKIERFRNDMISINSLIISILRDNSLYRDATYLPALEQGIIKQYDDFINREIKIPTHTPRSYGISHEAVMSVSAEISELRKKTITCGETLTEYKIKANTLSQRLSTAVYLVELADERNFKMLKDNLIDEVKRRTQEATKIR